MQKVEMEQAGFILAWLNNQPHKHFQQMDIYRCQ